MKASASLFVLLLITASFSQTLSGPAGSDLPICCFSYTHHKLPRKLIRRYYSTSTSCTLPAIVFITKKGLQVCANPSDSWVRSYLEKVKQK